MSDDPFDFLDDLEDSDASDDDVEHAGVAPDGDAVSDTSSAGDGDDIEPLFDDMYAFMNEFVLVTISRKLSEQSGAALRWDPDWWRYPEVVLRADLLWRSFEAARIKDAKDPGELEAWMRLVLDHHLAIMLNGATGPMFNNGGPRPTLGGTYPPGHSAHGGEEQADGWPSGDNLDTSEDDW